MHAKYLEAIGQLPENDAIVIKNRFGEIKINPMNKILFPHGLLGLHNCHYFAVAEHNMEHLKSFKLLQSTEHDEIALLVLPLSSENKLIALHEVQEVCAAMGYDIEALVIMLIASTRFDNEGKKEITINVRAPIFIDSQKFYGTQFVLRNDAYTVQTPLQDVFKLTT